MARQSYDEYEEDEDDLEGGEEEDQEEEDEKPSKEVLDFLKLREEFKEKIRQKYKKENAADVAPTQSLSTNGTTTDTKFGSFFGTSQHVIALRVIEERRSMREAQHIVSKAPSSTSSVGYIWPSEGKHVSSNAGVKSHSNSKPQKVVNELKRKVQTLKERRDYSFLLSDDSDLPAHTDDPAPPKNVSVPISGAQTGRSLPSPRMSMSKSSKQIPDSHLSRNSTSRGQHVEKGEYQKTVPPIRPKAPSSEPRKLQGEYQKTIPLSRSKASSSEPRKLLEGKGDGGHGQPLVAKAPSLAAAQDNITKKAHMVGGNKPSNIERAPLKKKTQSAVQNNYPQQRREIQDLSKGKLLPKQSVSSSKSQLSKPSKQIQQRSTHEDRSKQKHVKSHSRNPFDDDDDDIDDPMSFLRNKLLSSTCRVVNCLEALLNGILEGNFSLPKWYNSSKYQVDDDDDSDMEANFDDIMKEEQRSLRIARQEDEEQLRLIEEEERRERMVREAKRRKVMQR